MLPLLFYHNEKVLENNYVLWIALEILMWQILGR